MELISYSLYYYFCLMIDIMKLYPIKTIENKILIKCTCPKKDSIILSLKTPKLVNLLKTNIVVNIFTPS